MWIRQQERDQIQPLLQKLLEQTTILQSCFNDLTNLDSSIANAAIERALHIGCECITDIGNVIIDACIMRDPGSYTDIVTILQEEKVFDQELGEELLPIVSYRKFLAHSYLHLNFDDTKKHAESAIHLFHKSAEQIEKYISACSKSSQVRHKECEVEARKGDGVYVFGT